MMINEIIQRLDGVRASGNGRWIAKCPAHEDRSPSLAVTENDGVVLIHCFAGCSVAEICDAIGYDLSDLFPKELIDRPPGKLRMALTEAWRCIQFELTVLEIAASDLAKGKVLSAEDQARVRQAADKIREINEAVYGAA